MKHTLFCAAMLLLAVLLLFGCAENAPTETAEDLRAALLSAAEDVTVTDTSVIFTDAVGERREIAKNPENTVSLYASFTTLWYEAGGQVRGCIGGDTARNLYKEHIGRDITADPDMTVAANSASSGKWSVERIIALRPSLILCSVAMDGYAVIKNPAAAAGIPVVAVDYDTFEDYLKWFKVFCHLNDRADLWDSVALPVLNEVVQCIASLPENETQQVFAMFADYNSLQANTSGTVVGEMISLLGGVNIADSPYTADAERIPVNLETVYAADPDVIVVQCHADAASAKRIVEETYGDNAVWQALRAVREGRVYYLDKSLFHNKPNSRFGEAYRTLADILYGSSPQP